LTEQTDSSGNSPQGGDRQQDSPGLVRALGPWMSTAVVVGGVIGSGIFAKPGEIAASCGDFRIILPAWIFGGLISLWGTLCFAELATMLPHAGGIYVYLREAYGNLTAFLFGFSEFLFGRPASIGALAMFSASILLKYVPDFDNLWSQTILALFLIVVTSWVNVRGVLWGGHVLGWTTLVKSLFIVFIAMTPFVLTGIGLDAGVDSANYSTRITPKFDSYWQQFAAVLLAVMWAYNGWHDVGPVAEEIKDPQRNIPIAYFLGIGIIIALYVGVNLAYHGVLSMQEVADAGTETPQKAMARFLAPGGPGLIYFARLLMDGSILCSALGAANANLLLGPRISFAMGRDGTFAKFLGDVHGDYRTPHWSIIVQGGMSCFYLIVAALMIQYLPAFREKNPFDLLTDTIVYSASIFFMLSVLAVVLLRRRHPEWTRPYRTWGYPLTPILFLVSNALFLGMAIQAKLTEGLLGLYLTLFGLPVYWIWNRRK